MARLYETWAKRLRPSWGSGPKAQAFLGTAGAVLGDKAVSEGEAGLLEEIPSTAKDEASVRLALSERQIEPSPLLTLELLVELAGAAPNINRFRGQPLGLLLALYYAGFQGAVLVQQNGKGWLFESAAALAGVPGPTWDFAPGNKIGVRVNRGAKVVGTFLAESAYVDSQPHLFAVSDGETILLKINGGSLQTIILTGLTPENATATQVRDSILAQIDTDGSAALVASNVFRILTTQAGTGAELEIIGGTAIADLGITAGVYSGTGNVVDIDAVTVDELNTVVAASGLLFELDAFNTLFAYATESILFTADDAAEIAGLAVLGITAGFYAHNSPDIIQLADLASFPPTPPSWFHAIDLGPNPEIPESTDGKPIIPLGTIPWWTFDGGMDSEGNQFCGRFAVLFPSTAPDPGLGTAATLARLRRVVKAWRWAETICVGIWVTSSGWTFDWPPRTFVGGYTFGDHEGTSTFYAAE